MLMRCVLGVLLLATADTALAGDWPLFRGNPLQSGVAQSTLPDELDILWKYTTKDGVEAAAAIADGVVYLPTLEGQLLALDLANGKLKWAYKAGPFKAPPSVRDGRVYAGDADGLFHCVDAATGKKVWTFETGGEISSGANFAGKGIIFGSGDESLYCLSHEGKSLWTFKVAGGPVMASPAVVGNRTFVAGCDSTLHVLDAATGKELNAVDLGGQSAATAAVAGQQLFLGTMSNQFLAVDWQKAEVLWKFEAKRLPQPFYSSAAVTDRIVVAGSRDKRVHAFDRVTGQELWSFLTGNKVDSSPVVVGKRVVFGSLDRFLYVVDLANGKMLEKVDLGGPIAASPALADGRIVIGTQHGEVYCLGAKK
jgi:outer membrane protein assembly factor BamB